MTAPFSFFPFSFCFLLFPFSFLLFTSYFPVAHLAAAAFPIT